MSGKISDHKPQTWSRRLRIGTPDEIAYCPEEAEHALEKILESYERSISSVSQHFALH